MRRIISSEIIWSCAELGASLDGDQSTNSVTLIHFHTSLRRDSCGWSSQSTATISFVKHKHMHIKWTEENAAHDWQLSLTQVSEISFGLTEDVFDSHRCERTLQIHLFLRCESTPRRGEPWIHERLARDTTSVVLLTD